MKKVLSKAYRLALLAATLVLFLFSCANPLQFDAALEEGGKSLSAPLLIVNDSNYREVLDMGDSAGIDATKLDRAPVLGDIIGPVTITKVYFKGSEAIGFDFTSTQPVLAIYVKASTGGNRYDYPSPGVYGDTELYTQVNTKNDQNYEISHIDIAWSTGGTTTTTVPGNSSGYSISGVVFHDTNHNGTLDSGEAGLEGVTVSLSGGATYTTGSDGFYSFTNLTAGSYTVTSGGKTNYWPTPYDEPLASKALVLPESASGVNFGLDYETISGFAFKDTDADGVFDSTETGIANVSISLSGAASKTTLSDGDGSFSFQFLKGGQAQYTVSAGDVSGEFHTPYLDPKTSWTGSASESGVNFGYSHETISGLVFYDANRDDRYQAGEPLLKGFTLGLSNGATATSAADGSYVFDHLLGATTYTVTADDKDGFLHSIAASRTVRPENGIAANADFGFAVDYSWIPGKLANGFTIGYWKTNLDKAISGKTNGIQVSAAKLQSYVNALSSFALPPLNVSTMKAASDILSATGSSPTLLLSKQLMGSEFNYASGAYIGGNELVTRFFLYDGEYMLDNSGSFTSAQLLAQKDKYDAYNNSHGGAVLF